MIKKQIQVSSDWIGIPFLWNGQDKKGLDCVGLVHFFLKSQNILLIPLPQYNAGWEQQDSQLLIKEVLKCGKKIDFKEQLLPNDIIVFKIRNKIAHVGIYIGYGKFLHIFLNKKSGIDRLEGTFWGLCFYCGIRPTEIGNNNDTILNIPQEELIGDPVSLAIAFVSSFVLGLGSKLTIGAALVVASITTALSAAASYFAPKINIPEFGNATGSIRYGFGALENTASSEIPIPILYGQLKIAGNTVYQSTPDETVYRCDSLGEGIYHAISDIRVNDIDINNLTGCSYSFYSGDSIQTVDNRFSDYVPGLRNTAYLALTLQTSDELKGGFPTVTALCSGIKVKTWNGTIWSSGVVYSNNPAACIRDFLTNIRYGLGLSETLIDNISFGEVYDYCAEAVDDNEGSTEARYTIDYVIDSKRPALDILADMLSTCNGALIWSGNILRLKTEKVDSIIQNFGMDNIKESSFSYFYVSKDDISNRIKVQYLDKNQNYTKVFAIAEHKSNQDLRENVEGGQGILEKEVSILGITKYSRAVRQAYYALRKIQSSNIIIKFVTATQAIHCEPFDIITVSHDTPSWTNKPFRIVSITELDNDEMEITAVEYNDSIYNDIYSASTVSYSYNVVTNANAPLNNITGLTVSESKYINKDGVFISDITCSWTGISTGQEYFLHYLIKLKKGSGNYEAVGTTIDTEFTIPKVETNQTYYIKIITVSITGYNSSGTISNALTIVGKTSEMDTVANFTNTFTDEIVLSWTPMASGDLFAYEIRDIDAGWGSGDTHLIWRGLGNKYTIVRPVSRTPGTYYIKAIDNSGNYSTNASNTIPNNSIPAQPSISGIDFFGVCKLSWQDIGDKDLKFYEVWKSTNNLWDGEQLQEQKVTAGNFSGGISTLVNSPTESGDTFYWKVVGVDSYGSGDFSTAYTNNWIGISSGDISGTIGTTQITDEAITTPKLASYSVTATKVTTGELLTLTAQIKDAIINNAKIIDISAEKITAGIFVGGSFVVGTSGDIRSSDYVLDSSGFLLHPTTGLEINTGSIKSTALADELTNRLGARHKITRGFELGFIEANNVTITHPITMQLGAILSTIAFKWGNASIYFDGSDARAYFSDSSDWDIVASNADNWTIDMWVKHTDHVGAETYIIQWETDNNLWALYHTHGIGLVFNVRSASADIILLQGGEITDTNWHHIALCKVGNDYGLYLDGQQTANAINNDNTDTFTGRLWLGQYGGSASSLYFDGYMDEIRVQNSNVFNANPQVDNSDTIDVPTGAHSSDANTKLLLHCNLPTVLQVNSGTLYHNLTYINKTATTDIDISTAENWIDGSIFSYVGAAGFVYVYCNDTGTIKLSEIAPDYADTEDNQSGTLLYYKSGSDFWRCLGAVRIEITDTICRFQQNADVIYYMDELSFTCGVSDDSFSEASLTAVVPAISNEANFYMEISTSGYIYLRPVLSLYDNAQAGRYVYSGSRDYFGWFPVGIGSTSKSIFWWAADLKTVTGYVGGFRIAIR